MRWSDAVEIETMDSSDYETVTIEYRISGAYRRATAIDPPECPEVEVLSIRSADGLPVDERRVWPTDGHRQDWEHDMLEQDADRAANARNRD